MSTTEELRQRAINGVESYRTGYRAGLQDGEEELGLAKLTIEQLQARSARQDEHIARLEATILRCGITEIQAITDPEAMGYRPSACDGGGNGVCCSDPCAADAELRQMGLLK